MKKYLLIMTLALLGGVTQVKAWGDMYLIVVKITTGATLLIMTILSSNVLRLTAI